MQVRYSGYIYQTGREINAFTLLGTGSGTTLEYLQAYRGADDGIEFFGGTTNLRYFVDTAGGDLRFGALQIVTSSVLGSTTVAASAWPAPR